MGTMTYQRIYLGSYGWQIEATIHPVKCEQHWIHAVKAGIGFYAHPVLGGLVGADTAMATAAGLEK